MDAVLKNVVQPVVYNAVRLGVNRVGANVNPLLDAIAFNYEGVETYVTLNFETVETFIETNI